MSRRHGWQSDGTYLRRGLWRTVAGGAAHHGLPPRSVRRWVSRPCAVLGRTVGTLDVPGGPVLWDLDLAAVAAARARGAPDSASRDGSGTWVTRARLEEECGVSEQFGAYWRDQPSRLRPGEMALRTRPTCLGHGPRGGRPASVEFLLEDARAILRGEESEHYHAGGFGKRGAARRAAREDQARDWLRAALRACGPLTADVLT
jgi:hypothetical protein